MGEALKPVMLLPMLMNRERGTQRARQIYKAILPQVPRNRSRQGEPSHPSPGHVNVFTVTCVLPAQNAVRGGTRHAPTTCKAHTHLAHDRPIGDRRIAGDNRDRNLDCPLVTNLNSHSVAQRESTVRLIKRRTL